jgi:cytochrome c biogenesis protein CcmG/thiol:disulfide interchange protein DsbE
MNETISTPTGTIEPLVESVGKEQKGRRTGSRYLIWAGVVALLGLLGWGLLKAGETRPEAGDVAPAFAVELFDGYGWDGREAASLGDMQGKVVVLNFWASWCVECRVEAELLEQTWRRYRDQGVVFLGVAYVDAEHKSLAYLEEFDITYPNGADLGSSISNAYKITGVPETFFIGKDGTVSRYVLGPVNETVLVGEIETLLAQ